MKPLILLLTIFPLLVNAQLRPPCAPSFIEISPSFDDACINCGFNGYVGSTAGWDAQPVPADFCGVNPAPRWLGFIAPVQNATYTITPMNCAGGKGMQAALYHDTDEPALVCSVGCDTCGNVPLVLNATNLVIGVNYYFLLTGYDQDVCDFIISQFPPMGQPVPPISTTSAITGPVTVCPEGTFDFSIDPTNGAGYYIWESNIPGVKINGQESPVMLEGPVSAAVQATFPQGLSNGTPITVCVTPLNSCNMGMQRCKTVTVQNIPVTNLPKAVVCNEDAPYTLPWGATASTTGPYEHTYMSQSGCDSIVRQWVQVLGPKQSTQIKYVCAGTTVDVCGQEFSQSGEYQVPCTAANGCDSTITLKLNVLAPVAEILGSDTIVVCGNTSFTLYTSFFTGGGGLNFKSWVNENGLEIGTAESVTVQQQGVYTLYSRIIQGGNICRDTDTVHLIFDPGAPPLHAAIYGTDTINCYLSQTIQNATSDNPAAVYSWVGPTGFSADTSSIMPEKQGWYLVEINADGCTEFVSKYIFKNIKPPVAFVDSKPIGCLLSTALTAFFHIDGNVYNWVTPNGDTLHTGQIIVTQPGTYVLDVVNLINGCAAHFETEVTVDTLQPSVNVQVMEASPGLMNGAIDLTPVAGSYPLQYLWIFQGDTISNTQDLINLSAGIYIVQVTGYNDCDTILTIEVPQKTVSVSLKPEVGSWRVIPNPASNYLYLSRLDSGSLPEAGIALYNAVGRLLQRETLPEGSNMHLMDCRSIPSGTYYLEIVPLDHSPAERLRVVIIR